MSRVAYVVAYRDPHYVRTRTLTTAIASLDDVDLIVVRNRLRGALRYPETWLCACWARLRHRPDVWVVGFRGHESFAFLYPIMRGRRIVFDEFINLHGWLVDERRVLRAESRITRALDAYVRWAMRRSDVVLADTDADAGYSARVYGLPPSKFVVVPVGADESTFFPRPRPNRNIGPLEVLFVATMLPLHGVDVFLEAIRLLQARGRLDAVHVTVIGGRGKRGAVDAIGGFIREHRLEGAVTHLPWVDYSHLPEHVARADLCIGGPLGDTPQAHRVVTGKTFQFLAMGKATLVGETSATTRFADKENCLLVRQGSAEAVADAIAWAADHRAELDEIGTRGRAYFEAAFAARHVAAAVAPALRPRR